MESKSYEQILAECIAYMIANQNKITDFNKGSVIRTIFEAFSRILEEGYENTRLGYDSNLKAMAFGLFDFQKKNGENATVNVKFTSNSNVISDTTIPSGTKISDGSHVFVTAQKAVINNGSNESNIVVAKAEKIGLEYNVPANTVTSILTSVPATVVAVNNPAMATGGSNAETEADALIRFKKFLNGLQGTNYYGIESAILAINGVESVGIEEHFPPREEDHFLYNATIYIDDGSGNLDAKLKAEIQKTVDGDGSNKYPGLRPAGIQINVKPATGVSIAVEGTCIVDESVDSELIKSKIIETIKEYIGKLGIHENVVWSQLLNAILSTGVKDVRDLTINGTTGNVQISVSQIANFLSANIEVAYE